RAHDDLAGAVMAAHFVMQRAAVLQRHADHRLLRLVRRLADRLWHLARLAVTVADTAALIAHDDKRGKTEASAALHHLRDAVDVDELVDELAVALLTLLAAALAPAAPSATATTAFVTFFLCHSLFLQNSRPPSRAASASALMRP